MTETVIFLGTQVLVSSSTFAVPLTRFESFHRRSATGCLARERKEAFSREFGWWRYFNHGPGSICWIWKVGGFLVNLSFWHLLRIIRSIIGTFRKTPGFEAGQVWLLQKLQSRKQRKGRYQVSWLRKTTLYNSKITVKDINNIYPLLIPQVAKFLCYYIKDQMWGRLLLLGDWIQKKEENDDMSCRRYIGLVHFMDIPWSKNHVFFNERLWPGGMSPQIQNCRCC